MRRPPKPFVTEYKTSPRRHPAAASEPAIAETTRAPRLFENFTKPEPDDSYEAAMRAADALFSIPSREPSAPANETRPAAPDRHVAAPRAADPTAESVFERRPEVPTSESGGRILRAIEEAPTAIYAALEAEYAPKRRGRKPGSKNKPKIVDPSEKVADQTPSSAAFATQRAEDLASYIRPAPPVASGGRPAIRRVAAIPASSVAALPANMPASPAPSNGGAAPAVARPVKRRSWMQRVKPGEDWKRRRLPKVCW